MYLQGKLDGSIFGKKDLREQILELEEKIEQRREKLDTFNFEENDESKPIEETNGEKVDASDEIKVEKSGDNTDSKKQEDETIEF